jgi:hypothetical protein
MTEVNEINNFLVPLMTSIILILLGVITWSGRKWFVDFDVIVKGIMSGLDIIKQQINDMKVDNQLQNAAIHEIQTGVELRFRGVDTRFETKAKKIQRLEDRLYALESKLERISLHHSKNHPTDKL